MAPHEPADALGPLVDEVLAAAPRGCGEVQDPLDDLIRALRDPPSLEVCEQLLGGLRSHRCFDAMSRLADALMTAGAGYPYVRRQLAQALIERGQLNLAHGVLEEQVERLPEAQERERSEALGLLGRLYKQRFVTWSDDPERAAEPLRAAIGWYRRAYALDPAWHGANLVALTWRAERDGISLEGDPSKAVAEAVLADLRKTPLARWRWWTWAAAGEVSLALENWESVWAFYGKCASAPEVDGFMLYGAVRQLREIWGLGAGGGAENPAEDVLAALETRVVTAEAGGELGSSPASLARLSHRLNDAKAGERLAAYQAILGGDPTTPIEIVLGLISAAGSVCQVVDRNKYRNRVPSGGSGFLVAGEALSPAWRGRVLLATNHHVLSEDGSQDPSVARERADAIFHLHEGDTTPHICAIGEILAHSPRTELDFTVASLGEGVRLPRRAFEALCTDRHVLGRRDRKPPARVFVVGHPRGRGIELGLGGNHILDHQLDEDDAEWPGGYRRIHYHTPTDHGMSGSPVLEGTTLEVIGIHRQGGSVRPLRRVQNPAAYRANEAVWIQSIVEALAAV